MISSKRRDGVEIRGFAPIGILEQWNNGIMGSGRLGQWFPLLNRVPSGEFNRVNWQNTIDKEVNRWETSLQNHHSNIPVFPGPDLASMDSVLYLRPAKYYSDKIVFRPSRAYNCASWRPWAHLVVWVPDGTSAITTYGIPKMPYVVIRVGHYSLAQTWFMSLVGWFYDPRPGLHASQDHPIPSHQGRPCARQYATASKNSFNFAKL